MPLVAPMLLKKKILDLFVTTSSSDLFLMLFFKSVDKISN